jgi:sulfopyruvate decarboxylase subunit beta
MLKQEATRTLAKHKGGMISVSTMQAGAPWHDTGEGRAMHIDATACMGSASSLGLGMALGRPDKKVFVLDGDGSLLMQLGSLVSIAAQQAPNFYHFVFANGLYESSGNQPLPGQGIFDFVALAKAAGYRSALRFDSAEELDRALPAIFETVGPVFVELKIARDDATPRWAGIPMARQVAQLKQELAAS